MVVQQKNDAGLQVECSELKRAVELLQKQVKEQGELLAQLHGIDYDMLSPKQAFDLLWSMRK